MELKPVQRERPENEKCSMCAHFTDDNRGDDKGLCNLLLVKYKIKPDENLSEDELQRVRVSS